MRKVFTTHGFGTAMLTGAFFLFSLSALFEEAYRPKQMIGGLLAGAVYGLASLLLLRLFRPRTWDHLVAGLLVGPVPFLLTLGTRASHEDRGGLIFVGLLMGLFVGATEWARRRREG